MKSKQSVKTTTESIICPECGQIQKAKIKHTIPFDTYIHECEKCKYIIMESEWQRVDSNNEKKLKLWKKNHVGTVFILKFSRLEMGEQKQRATIQNLARLW